MLKRFLHGLMFGAGFAVAWLVVMSLYGWAVPMLVMRSLNDDSAESLDGELAVAPAIASRFLGSTGRYSGDYTSFRNGPALAAGPGKIVGKVVSSGLPVAGLRLRLALNGSVLSRWTTTDAQGAYALDVPLGRYRIDGYELDTESANRALAGKIERPGVSGFSSSEFDVSQNVPGEGPTLEYVDPVVILGPSGTVSLRDGVVLRWASYPGAASYVLQLYEADDAYDFPDDPVFDFRERPRVGGTSFDLTANGTMLQSGRYYSAEIDAQDATGRPLADSGRSRRSNFRVVD